VGGGRAVRRRGHAGDPGAAPSGGVSAAARARGRRGRLRHRHCLRVDRISAPRLNDALERVRVSVRKGTAPAVGSFVSFKARLSPPLEPLRPGGYDFARDLYFQRIGASGFVLGRIQTAEPPRAFPTASWCEITGFVEVRERHSIPAPPAPDGR
jgi:Domain of unknown function (DUF4131)